MSIQCNFVNTKIIGNLKCKKHYLDNIVQCNIQTTFGVRRKGAKHNHL